MIDCKTNFKLLQIWQSFIFLQLIPEKKTCGTKIPSLLAVAVCNHTKKDLEKGNSETDKIHPSNETAVTIYYCS